jgi:hypothetical protein
MLAGCMLILWPPRIPLLAGFRAAFLFSVNLLHLFNLSVMGTLMPSYLNFKQISIGDLEPNSFFSFTGKTFFILSRVEVIGAGLVQIRYMHTKRWQSWEKVVRSAKKAYVAPIGRHYDPAFWDAPPGDPPLSGLPTSL